MRHPLDQIPSWLDSETDPSHHLNTMSLRDRPMPNSEQGADMTDSGEHGDWTISIDAQWKKVTVRIPTDGTPRCIFASIAPQSIVVYSIGTADETEAPDPIDSIRLFPLPFKVVPESSSARFEEKQLVLVLSRLGVEAENAVDRNAGI